MAKKVIIDCDVGVDDALALILAFHSPELEVQAVTGVNGNVPLRIVYPNIKRSSACSGLPINPGSPGEPTGRWPGMAQAPMTFTAGTGWAGR